MADINIQPKKQSPLPYILGLVALLAVIFLIYYMQSRPDPEKTSEFFQDTTRIENAGGDTLSKLRDTTVTDTTKRDTR